MLKHVVLLAAPLQTALQWTRAAGETRIGIFTTRRVEAGEELTYDYHFQHSGLQTAAQGFRCMCGAPRCRGTMDAHPERIKDAGRRVRVYWENDGQWYEGRVLHYAPSTDKHTIFYPGQGESPLDGEKESLVLAEVQHEWLDEPFPDAEQAARSPVPAAAVAAAAINPQTQRPAGQAAAQACAARLCEAWPGQPAAAVAPAAAPAQAAAYMPASMLMPAVGPPSAQRVTLPAPLPAAAVGGPYAGSAGVSDGHAGMVCCLLRCVALRCACVAHSTTWTGCCY